MLSSLWGRGLVEAVHMRGVAASTFLAKAGLAPDRFADAYAWLSVEEFDGLAALAVELTDDPAFGLHWVELSPMNGFDLFAMLAAHAPTLRHAVSCLADVQLLLWRHPALELVERDGTFGMWYAEGESAGLGARLRAELVTFGYLRFLRYAGVPDAAIRGIELAHRRPSYAAAYARLAPVPPRFGRARSGVVVALEWLDRPLVGANPELFEVLKGQAKAVLTRIQDSTGYAPRVRDFLSTMLPRVPQMPETARALSLSVRSLQRRLADEGWSYSKLIEAAQLDAARRLLADPTTTVKRVGYEVGFTSPAAFVRAFKRWTEHSPSEFRARLK